MLRSLAPIASLSLAALVALAGPAWSLDPHKSLTQYTRAVWTQANGLPQDNIRAITQTTDGYLWVGTDDGLARFDGYDFITFNKDDGALPSNSVASLAAGRDGALWIGTTNGLVRYLGGKFRTFTTKEGLPDNFISSLYEDHNSELWIVAGVFLSRFKNGHFTNYPASALLPARTARSIDGDSHGVWVAGIDGLVKNTGQRFEPVLNLPQLNEGGFVTVARDRKENTWIAGRGIVLLTPSGKVRRFGMHEGLPNMSVRALIEDRDGNIWAGTTEGLSRLEGDRFVSHAVDSQPNEGFVRCLFEDREGNLWVGMTNGLHRFRDDDVTNYGRPEGLPSDEPIAVHQDQKGRVWAGYRGDGVSAVGESQAPHYTIREGLLNDRIFAIRESREGELWMVTYGGVNVIRQGRLETFLLPRPNIRYYLDILQDRQGHVWLGTSDGVFRMKGQDLQSIVPVVPGGVFFNDAAVVLSEGSDDSIWAGTYGTGLWRIQDSNIRRYTRADGLASEQIRSLLEDSDRTLWIGTYGGGLNAFRNGTFTHYTARDGLLSDNISHIDDDGFSLWLATTRGVCRISKQQLRDFSAGKIRDLTPVNYTAADGLRSAQCAPGIPVGAGGTKTSDGRIWVPTGRGLAVIDPHANLKRLTESAPAVHLVAVNVDGHDLSLSGPARLKAGPDHVQFRYTGIHLGAPERVRYQYMLEGLDRDWNSAADRRVINFNSLHHGIYRFRVRASLGASESNEASFQFEVQPHFYEEGSFLWLCVASLFAAAFSLHRLRLKQMRSRFALVLEERTRIAREIHDTLAQGFFGISSQLNALALKMSGQSEAAKRDLDLAQKMAHHSITESRRSVMNLRDSTIENRDLPSALTRGVRQWAEASASRIEIEFGRSIPKLPEDMEQNTYRIAQEAVANALKHAGANTIRIGLQVEHQRLELTIEDDGRGFEPSFALAMRNGHYGLLGMRERAEHMGGEMELTSAPAAGTLVKITLPLPSENSSGPRWRQLTGALRIWRRPLILWFRRSRSGF